MKRLLFSALIYCFSAYGSHYETVPTATGSATYLIEDATGPWPPFQWHFQPVPPTTVFPVVPGPVVPSPQGSGSQAPEPGTWHLIGMGLSGIGLLQWFRRESAR